MGLFDKLKKKEKVTEEKEVTDEDIKKAEESFNLNDLSECLLADVRKDDIADNSFALPLDNLSALGPLGISSFEIVSSITNSKFKGNSGDKLYKVANLGKNSKLKATRNGDLFWGTMKNGDGSTSWAKFEEVPGSVPKAIDPTTLMVAAALYSIEKEIAKIEDIANNIMDFLDNEKEAQIEADVEILKKVMIEVKYNTKNEKYINTYYNQIATISRNAHKDILTFKRKIESSLSKTKMFTTSKSMKEMLKELLNTFKYYRLSLFICSFSTYLELFLSGNLKSEFLLGKRDELNKLAEEYTLEFNKALDFIKKQTDKSIEANVLSGLGSAGNLAGNLVEKVKEGSVDTWLHEKSDSLKKSSESIKDNYIKMFEKVKDTNAKTFISQIERLDKLYNKTENIYFDKKCIYLQSQSH